MGLIKSQPPGGAKLLHVCSVTSLTSVASAIVTVLLQAILDDEPNFTKRFMNGAVPLTMADAAPMVFVFDCFQFVEPALDKNTGMPTTRPQQVLAFVSATLWASAFLVVICFVALGAKVIGRGDDGDALFNWEFPGWMVVFMDVVALQMVRAASGESSSHDIPQQDSSKEQAKLLSGYVLY